jgi:FK506-binding nuclear protein
MPVAVALWSTVVKPGQSVSVIPQGDLVITNAALGIKLADSNGRTSIKLTYTRPVKVDDSDEEEDGDEAALVETVLCSLTPGKIEHCILNLTFEEDDEFLLEVVGKNEVYLTGNYIDQAPDQVPYNDDDDDDESEQEGEYALDEVSSDVEINPADIVGLPIDEDEDEDAGRFEEVVSEEEAEVEKSAKRRRVSDATEQDAPTSDKLSKKAKKLKAENGAAVPAPTGTDAEASKKGKKNKKKKGEDAKESHPQTGEDKESEPRQKQGDKGNMRELPGGLQIRDAKPGEGPQAKKGVRLSMRYVGKLPNGKVFDSNTTGKPFTFRLGAGEVIKGWDEGIAGMKVGGERLLIVPPSLAYGNKTMDGIPSNSTLRFEVKLVGMK